LIMETNIIWSGKVSLIRLLGGILNSQGFLGKSRSRKNLMKSL